MKQIRILRVVVASPGDVQAERDALPKVIDELNRDVAADRGLRLELHRWETDAHPGFHPDGPQGLIDPILRIEECDVLIGIFWKRFGTPVKDSDSGTEHEFRLAYKAWKETSRPQLMIYFNQKPYAPKTFEETEQWSKVLRFKESFPVEGLWWTYKGKPQFEQLVRQHLANFIRNLPKEPDDSVAATPQLQSPKSNISQKGDRNAAIGGNVSNSILITGDQNQVTLNGAARSSSTLTVTPERVDELIHLYKQQLTEKVSRIRLLGEEEAFPLEKVFVELTIIDRPRLPLQANPEELKKAILKWRKNSSTGEDDAPEKDGTQVNRTIKPDDLLRPSTHAIVTGAPGSGKTTLLRYLVWQTLKQEVGILSGGERTDNLAPLFPVFLELKQLTSAAFQQSQGQLEELLFAQAIAATLKPDLSELAALKQYFFNLLRTGRVAVFLDGLDEVSGASFFRDLQTAVSEFLQSVYGGNTLIISTRPFALRQIGDAQMMEILPLNQRQIEQFILYYYSDQPYVQRLLPELRRHTTLRELARVPALLGFIVRMLFTESNIATDRLVLYHEVVRQLSSQFDHEKLVERNFQINDPDGSLKRDFLRHLAFQGLFSDLTQERFSHNDTGRLVFTSEMIAEEAKAFCQSENLTISSYLLAADVKATPLLREVAADTYAFAHLTLQEYLAATVLAKRDDCERIFSRAYFNPTLAEMEVLPMTLGLVSEPERFYQLLEQLPESLDFKRLRMRARGLAYVGYLNQLILTKLADEVASAVEREKEAKSPYEDIIINSFSGAIGQSLEVITNRVIAILHSQKPFTDLNAVLALGKIGGEHSFNELIKVLEVEDETLRSYAALALGTLGDGRAVTPLLKALKDESGLVRSWAAESLARIGAENVTENLLELLKDSEGYVRLSAAKAIGAIGDNQAVEGLETLLREDNSIRCPIALALGLLGDERAVDIMLEVLKDPNWQLRGIAAEALEDIGDQRAVPSLLEALNDSEREVRFNSAHALVGLLKPLNDPERKVRLNPAYALTAIDREKIVAKLLEALESGGGDADKDVRWRAAEALGKIGNELAVDRLLEALKKNDSPDARWRAAEALGEIGGERAIEGLLKELVNPNQSAIQSVALALGKNGYQMAFEECLRALRHNDEHVRWRAADALGVINNERAVAELLKVIKTDRFRSPSKKAAESLERFDIEILAKGLLRSLGHDDSFVRRKAVEVIGYYVS